MIFYLNPEIFIECPRLLKNSIFLEKKGLTWTKLSSVPALPMALIGGCCRTLRPRQCHGRCAVAQHGPPRPQEQAGLTAAGDMRDGAPRVCPPAGRGQHRPRPASLRRSPLQSLARHQSLPAVTVLRAGQVTAIGARKKGAVARSYRRVPTAGTEITRLIGENLPVSVEKAT